TARSGSCRTLRDALQVIVMSGHETIRVLEVGVDAPLPAGEDRKALEMPAEEPARGSPGGTGDPAGEDVPAAAETPGSGDTAGETLPSRPPSLCRPHPSAAQRREEPPQALPPSPRQVAGQQGLAVWTIPTATVAALPGLTAASPTGGIFKAPIANVQAAAVLNTTIQAPVQPAPPPPRLPAQPPGAFALAPSQAPLLPQPPKAVETQAQITVQPTGFAFNAGIISTAALGGQPQLLGSLAAAPVLANAVPGMQGLAGQLVTNAQGQVIGTLPWVLNPPTLTAPAPGLQVQAVTPQLLLNAQGQVIATLASSTLPPAAAAAKKPGAPESPAKSEVQPIQPALPQPAVVIASAAPGTKPPAAPAPVACPEAPTVSQLVSSESRSARPERAAGPGSALARRPAEPQAPGAEEDGINLEEIREFAKNFKIRRLSLGLTQTQVGQALTATEGPAYSQSAICRFEKLDITPKSAQKLKPVLEKWLSEAELRNQEGQQNLLEFVGGEPSKKRKRRTSFTPQAIEALNAHFEKNALPTGQEITEIAKELNYDREVVRVWFCNRRQTLKNTSKLNVFQIP
ncbi:PO6F1 factor, partial [Eudromia elegans]|nr:PO6F1 factor [Eudromia elegans]